MDNFDLKKYLVENRLTSKTPLNEDSAKVYQMDNINVEITDYPGQSVFIDNNNKEVRVQYNTKNPGDGKMVFKTPPTLKNLSPMFQNVPKLEREIWAAITEEFRKLDERLPSIVQQVLYNYEPSLSEEKIDEMATLIKKKSSGSEKPLQVGDIITWKQEYSTGDNYYGTSYKRMKGKITKILGSANVEAEDSETGDLYKVSRKELTILPDGKDLEPTRKGPDPYASNY